MEAFFLSSLVAFILTLGLMAASTTWSRDYFRLRIGGVLNARIKRNVFAVGGVVLLLAIGAAVGWVVVARIFSSASLAYSLHDFLIGPLFIGMILGFLFGVLFAFWLRELISLPEGELKTSKLVFQAIVLAVLLGLGGFSDVLRPYASRVQHIGIAGAELDFTPISGGASGGKAQSSNAAYTIRPEDKLQKYTDSLDVLVSLGNRVRADQNYIANNFAKVPGVNAVDSVFLDRNVQFYNETVGAYAACLQALAHAGADDEFIDDRVRELIPSLREIAYGGEAMKENGERQDRVVAGSLNAFSKLLKSMDYSFSMPSATMGGYDFKEAKEGCEPFVSINCGSDVKVAPGFSETCDVQARRSAETKTMLNAMLSDPDLFDRPYVSLLYAAALWRVGEFSGAVDEIDGWLRRMDEREQQKYVLHPWYEVRARIHMATIIGQWIRSSANLPLAIREYHLNNLHTMIDRMESLLPADAIASGFGTIGESYQNNRFRSEPVWSDKCSLGDAKNYELFKLDMTLLSNYAVYIYNAVRMPDYYDNYSTTAVAYVNLLTKVNLGCISAMGFPALQEQIYLAVLEGYSETELLYGKGLADLPDSSLARRELELARDSAALGLNRAKLSAKKDRDDASKNADRFSETIEAQQAGDYEMEFARIVNEASNELKDIGI